MLDGEGAEEVDLVQKSMKYLPKVDLQKFSKIPVPKEASRVDVYRVCTI